MRILFLNSFYHFPQTAGGLANTLHELATQFIRIGHDVGVLCALKPGRTQFNARTAMRRSLSRLRGGASISCDRGLGYPVWRAWQPIDHFEIIAHEWRADVIVIMGGTAVPLARRARSAGFPVVVQLHDMEHAWLDGPPEELAQFPVITNSQFTQRYFAERFGVESEVIYPIIGKNKYQVENTGRFVTFIHPIARKGVGVATQIAAACSEIPFLFIGNASLDEGSKAALADLSNVICRPTTSNMREVYRETRILLVPSQWQEAFGRVVCEAQLSGIPSLASDRGGIPEALGDGGIILPYNAPAEEWVKKLRSIWNDPTYYEGLSSRAQIWANRDVFDENFQIESHLKVYSDAFISA